MAMQVRRTLTANNPPADGTLAEGQFSVELATVPPRLWVGGAGGTSSIQLNSAISDPSTAGNFLRTNTGNWVAGLPLSGGTLDAVDNVDGFGITIPVNDTTWSSTGLNILVTDGVGVHFEATAGWAIFAQHNSNTPCIEVSNSGTSHSFFTNVWGTGTGLRAVGNNASALVDVQTTSGTCIRTHNVGNTGTPLRMYTDGVDRLVLAGNGVLILGTPTGGTPPTTAGNINVSGGYYVNGVRVPEEAPQDARIYGRRNAEWRPTFDMNVLLEEVSTATAPNGGPWRGVAYGNGVWVAMSQFGAQNVTVSSTDGVTWTAGTNGSGAPGIAYGSGRFVAASAANARVSTDGVNWSANYPITGFGGAQAIAHGDGQFIAAGNSGANRIARSGDGQTWTVQAGTTEGLARTWTGIAYGNGVWIVTGGAAGQAGRSTDGGVTWEVSDQQDLSNSYPYVAYGNGRFVAISSSSINTRVSTDGGVTWVPGGSLTGGSTFNRIVYGGGIFVVVAQAGTTRMFFSVDGMSWVGFTPSQQALWQGLAYGDGKFVAMGQTTIIWTGQVIPRLIVADNGHIDAAGYALKGMVNPFLPVSGQLSDLMGHYTSNNRDGISVTQSVAGSAIRVITNSVSPGISLSQSGVGQGVVVYTASSGVAVDINNAGTGNGFVVRNEATNHFVIAADGTITMSPAAVTSMRAALGI